MRLLALDLGDQWTGSAITDRSGILAMPYTTVATKNLVPFLKQTIKEEDIEKVIIGHPLTLKGTESPQTVKVIEKKKFLEEQFPSLLFVLWDERLTSKLAEHVARAQRGKDRLQIHARAAAFVLESYLEHVRAIDLSEGSIDF